MKKQYVKPQFTFISNLSQLESIRQWNSPDLLEKTKHSVEVMYVECEQCQQHTALQSEK